LLLIDRLAALYPGASRTTLRKWLAAGRVRVRGEVARRAETPVAATEHVQLGAPPPPEFPAPLRLIHEEEQFLVVDKPAGLLTIATERERDRTAYRLLADYVQGQARAGRGPRLFVVHRLDRETSGLLVFAKSGAAKGALQAQFKARRVERLYVAVVDGRVEADEGRLESFLVQDRSLRVRASRDTLRGKEAVTLYRVLERRRDSTVLELGLQTGRRGQIRAQLSELGHPVTGDAAYGSRRNPVRRICLHATRLGFIGPDGRPRRFDSPPPPEFRRA
jgi:23S rRNA pseudouridine1911/1915/1917 synthase